MTTRKNTTNGKKESVIKQLRLIFPDKIRSITHALDIKEVLDLSFSIIQVT